MAKRSPSTSPKGKKHRCAKGTHVQTKKLANGKRVPRLSPKGKRLCTTAWMELVKATLTELKKSNKDAKYGDAMTACRKELYAKYVAEAGTSAAGKINSDRALINKYAAIAAGN